MIHNLQDKNENDMVLPFSQIPEERQDLQKPETANDEIALRIRLGQCLALLEFCDTITNRVTKLERVISDLQGLFHRLSTISTPVLPLVSSTGPLQPVSPASLPPADRSQQ